MSFRKRDCRAIAKDRFNARKYPAESSVARLRLDLICSNGRNFYDYRMSSKDQTRRSFIKSTALAGVTISGPNLLLGQAKGANSRLRVGVMGLSRGKGHIRAFLDVPNCEIAYLCDVDRDRLASGDNTMSGKQEAEPKLSLIHI